MSGEGEDVVIRPVRPEDFEAIAALTNHFIVNTSIHFGYEEVSAAELRASWKKSKRKYPFLVAEVDGAYPAPRRAGTGPPQSRFAGFAKSGVWRDRAAYQWTVEGGIYVSPALHRRGVGRRLYGALIDECRRCGFHSFVGGITLPNEASVRLHEAMGFVKVGQFKDAGWKFGAWHDVGFWQLMLGDREHRGEPLAVPRM